MLFLQQKVQQKQEVTSQGELKSQLYLDIAIEDKKILQSMMAQNKTA